MSENSVIPERVPGVIQPIPPEERIHTLDVLRGFALLGIMFVNVTAFVQPSAWFAVHWEELGPVNYAVEVLKLFFTQGKFYTLFAFLFGLGFAVQLARAERVERGFAARFFWRIVLLWLIGIFHIVFLWDGDILNTYAVGGLILLLCYGAKRGVDRLVRRFSKGRREKSPRWLVPVMAGLLIFGPLAAFAGFVNHALNVQAAAEAGEVLSESDQGILKQIESMSDPKRAVEREQEMAAAMETFANGSYIDTVSWRIEHLPSRTLSGPFWFMIAGIFMLGAWFGRNDFIRRAGELRPQFRKLLVISLLVGVPLSALFVYVQMNRPELPALSWQHWLDFFAKTASGLAFMLVYVAAISLLMLTRARRWLEYLAPVGRMALSNYLLQSLLGTLVFYGYGLGFVGKLDSTEQLFYIALVFGGQIMLSRWWLARFRFGPAEWLWRSLTYFKRQPMRVRGVEAEATLAHS